MKKILFLFLLLIMGYYAQGQIQYGTWRTTSNNTDYHFFTRNGTGAAVYINQVSGQIDKPILRLSSGTASPNQNVKFTFENNGSFGIGTSTPKSKLHVYGSSERMIFEAEDIQVENSARIEFWELPATSNAEEAQFAIQYDGKSDMLRFKGKVGSALDQDLMVVRRNGAVGIGTILSSNPHNYKLAVNGTIGAKEVKVETSSSTWADFVFEEHYSLPTLQEVEIHIREKGHLKDIPSAQEVGEHGINLGEMDAKLLQKIEELTLYMIEQNAKTDRLLEKVKELELENKTLNEKMKNLAAQ